MNIQVHLIRSSEVSRENLQRVANYLQGFPGVMAFKTHDFSYSIGRNIPLDGEMKLPKLVTIAKMDDSVFFQPVNKKEWSNPDEHPFLDFFEICDAFRAEHHIAPEDHVFLLTSKRNSHNWFAAPDKDFLKKNYFIQMDEWEFYTQSDNLYPVAYQLATLMLKSYMFRAFSEYEAARHMRPIGCMLDFCQRKKDISIKMRTADICPDCQQLILERGVPPILTSQTLRIMDSIRQAILFKERFQITQQSPGIWISANGKDIGVNDIGNLSFQFNPLENAMYRFFLNHPEGVQLSFLQDHRSEILALYTQNDVSGSAEQIESRINELVDPNSNSASEKISRIKRKIIALVGSDMSNDLIIHGKSGEPKKIHLDRSRVEFR